MRCRSQFILRIFGPFRFSSIRHLWSRWLISLFLTLAAEAKLNHYGLLAVYCYGVIEVPLYKSSNSLCELIVRKRQIALGAIKSRRPDDLPVQY